MNQNRLSRVVLAVRFIPDGLHVKALADLDDGSTAALFRFYPDELSFTTDELVGRTHQECLQLFSLRDEQYLKSEED